MKQPQNDKEPFLPKGFLKCGPSTLDMLTNCIWFYKVMMYFM